MYSSCSLGWIVLFFESHMLDTTGAFARVNFQSSSFEFWDDLLNQFALEYVVEHCVVHVCDDVHSVPALLPNPECCLFHDSDHTEHHRCYRTLGCSF